MPQPTAFTLRLSESQERQLDRIAAKLNIDKTNVIRLAITRLAEAEGVLYDPKPSKHE